MENSVVKIMEHALGRSYLNKPHDYRNYYCTWDGDPELEKLVALGYMKRGQTLNEGRDPYYHVTDAGTTALDARECPRCVLARPKKSK